MTETTAPLAEGPAWFSRLSAKDGGKYMKVILSLTPEEVKSPKWPTWTGPI